MTRARTVPGNRTFRSVTVHGLASVRSRDSGLPSSAFGPELGTPALERRHPTVAFLRDVGAAAHDEAIGDDAKRRIAQQIATVYDAS